VDASRERSEDSASPDGAPRSTSVRLHIGVQIVWLVGLVTLGLAVILSDDGECAADTLCVFEGRGDLAVLVVALGGVIWAVGAIVIALFAWTIRAAQRRARRAGIHVEPG
jgi:hypothetical protein